MADSLTWPYIITSAIAAGGIAGPVVTGLVTNQHARRMQREKMAYDYRLARIDKTTDAYMWAMNSILAIHSMLAQSFAYQKDLPPKVYEECRDTLGKIHASMVVYGTVKSVKSIDEITTCVYTLIDDIRLVTQMKNAHGSESREYLDSRQAVKDSKLFLTLRKHRSDFMWEAHQQIANALPNKSGEPWSDEERSSF